MPTRRPSSSSDPVAAASPRRIAWKTVSAVTGEGSPPPPFSTRAPDGEAGEARHVVHVRGGRPDVLGGDVRAVEPLDHAGGSLETRGARRSSRPSSIITALPPPSSRPAADAFKRHRARQAHHVLERLAQSAGVALEAHAAECGAQHRRVHGDDEAQPRLGILADDDLLVIVVSQGDVPAARAAGWQWSSDLDLIPGRRLASTGRGGTDQYCVPCTTNGKFASANRP